ncbi:hypothetical protein RMATCC62417_08667 [Rhizopus microsporus]|nr:hypothetical protein RMATCC62417_08667 [Rhizopus microsporus]CEI85967.1 hypothetical protein RMCBS344292_00416 [Rhizopus microsporus]
MNSFSSFLNFKRSPTERDHHKSDNYTNQADNAITISFEDTYYDVDFGQLSMNQLTVADLKERCKRITGVPLAIMNLKVSGANIKDDTATLPSVGIYRGSVVYVFGEKTDMEQTKLTVSGNPEEVGYMTRVSKIMEKVNNSKNKIEEFDMMVICILQNVDSGEQKRKEAETLGIYLYEILMQALIALDGVNCPFEFQTARANRKKGVKECQELMDRIEKSREALKAYYN